MRALAFLTDVRDIDDFDRAQCDATIIAIGEPAHRTLAATRREHLTPFDLTTNRDQPAYRALVADARAWWRRVEDDRLHLAAYRHDAWIRRAAWLTFITQRAFDQLAPDHAFVFDEGDAHGLEQPAGASGLPLLSAIVRAISDAQRASVTVLPRATTFDDVARRESSTSAQLNDMLPGGAIVIHANRNDLVRQAPLARALHAQGTPVVVIYAAAEPDELACVAGLDVRHVSAFGDGDGPPNAGADPFAPLRDAPAALRPIFDNPHLTAHEAFLRGPYTAAIDAHVRRWSRVFTATPPALVINAAPTPLADIATRLGIPTLHLPHGLVVHDEAALLGSLAGGQIGVLGDAHAVRCGIDHRRLAVTGDAASQRLRSIRRAEPTGPVILLTAAPALGVPDIDWRRAAVTNADLQAALKAHGVPVIVRGHPRRSIDAFSGLPQDEGAIDDVLTTARAALAVNCTTSALVETSLAGVPTAILDTAMSWVDHGAIGTDAWPILRSIEDALAWIREPTPGSPIESFIGATADDWLEASLLQARSSTASQPSIGSRP